MGAYIVIEGTVRDKEALGRYRRSYGRSKRAVPIHRLTESSIMNAARYLPLVYRMLVDTG
jgi:hypothetical protein